MNQGISIALGSVVGIIIGVLGFFIFKRIQEQSTKKNAKSEADRILQKAKSEAARIKKESENSAKDFETRARKNAEIEIQKQKNQMKSKEGQLERKMRDLDDQHKTKMEDLDRQLSQMKDRDQKLRNTENRIRDLEKKQNNKLKTFVVKLNKLGKCPSMKYGVSWCHRLRTRQKQDLLLRSKKLRKRQSEKLSENHDGLSQQRYQDSLRNTQQSERSVSWHWPMMK